MPLRAWSLGLGVGGVLQGEIRVVYMGIRRRFQGR